MRALILMCLVASPAFAQIQPAVRLIGPDGSLTRYSENDGLETQHPTGWIEIIAANGRALKVALAPDRIVGVVVPGPVVGLAPGQRVLIGANALDRMPPGGEVLTPVTTIFPDYGQGENMGVEEAASADGDVTEVVFGDTPDAAAGAAADYDLAEHGEPMNIVILDTSAGFWTHQRSELRSAAAAHLADTNENSIVITDTSAGFWAGLTPDQQTFAAQGGLGIKVLGMVSAMPSGIDNQ